MHGMHPGMMAWWTHARRAAQCGAHGAHWGAGASAGGEGDGRWHAGHGGHDDHESDFGGGGGSFGVRRPLRFLAYKLELNETQVTELARVLNELKTERAQAAVDHRRTTSAFADALSGETFDEAKVKGAAAERVKSAERLRDAATHALGRIHALLEPAQRVKLAYLIRTGALSI